MSLPFAPFLLFSGLFSIVALILIAKIRADARRRGPAMPSARLAGKRPPLAQRIHEPGAYAYGFGVSALLSAMLCSVLAYIHHRPDPPTRRPYRITNPIDGTQETRELTDKELREQYETTAEGLRRLRSTQ